MKRILFYLFIIVVIFSDLRIGDKVGGAFGQVKLSTAQQLQNSNFLLAAEKADTEKLILEKAGKQNTINQLNNKLVRTQNIIKGLVKDGKIKIEDLAPLTSLGYNFGPGAELPSSLPDSVSTKGPDDIRKK